MNDNVNVNDNLESPRAKFFAERTRIIERCEELGGISEELIEYLESLERRIGELESVARQEETYRQEQMER